MNNIQRPRGLQRSFWASTLLVVGFVLFQSHTAVAQVTGSGTVNKIPKWTGSTTLNDSAVSEVGGNVGIGTASPTAQLHITQQLRIDGTDVGGYHAIGFGGNSPGPNPTIYSNGYYLVLNGAGGNLLYLNWDNGTGSTILQGQGGNVGIGAISPGFKLQIDGASATGSGGNAIADGLTIRSTNTINGIQLMHSASTAFMALNTDSLGSGALGIGTKGNFPLYFYTNSGVAAGSPSTAGIRMAIDTSGNVGIGTVSPSPSNKLQVVGNAYVTANLTVDGNIAAKYQDVAEWVPATRAIPAGTVVVLDIDQSNHVLPSSRAYDTRVAGVVSASPGVILGEGGEGRVMVATTGRVRVKVDATRAPIRVGDLLVTSDKEGIAMRSVPLDLGGTPIHRPGTLIGKALEPLEKGVGEILVLLSLQ